MPFCQRCGEIVESADQACPCGGRGGDASASGMSARDNRGDGISSAYLSSGLRGGVEAGLRRMMGDDSQPVDHACLDCGRRLTCESELFVGPAHAGGQVYCEACYSRQFKKGDCETCRKPVLGLGREYVMQEGKVWHKECFSGRSCHECSEVVFGQGVEAIGKVFHPECFVCFNCKQRIASAFVDFNGEPCCKPCNQQIRATRAAADAASGSGSSAVAAASAAAKPAAPRGAAAAGGGGGSGPTFGEQVPDLAMRCDGCLEVVRGGDGGVQLPDGKLFHEGCFKCRSCSTPINGKYVLDAGQIYHPECRVALVAGGANPVCQKCRKPITGRFVKLDEATLLHGECFVCAGCGTGLGGQAFGDTAQGPKCEGCLRKQASAGPKFVPGFTVNQAGLKEVRGPGGAKVGDNAALKALGGTTTCPKCAKGVFPFEKVGGPLNTSWHKACLKCTKCSRALDSMAKMRELEPFCTACATF
ncbi:hypothetical protein HK105_206523 [Polyrhizophydium stewartii]|uniref:LIM zinc-binding domain-containing protein n=1 Tax=Polyrhizophydium stewartii TaxID=2732419 RepID=A0ABR4N309_9FUNG